MDGYELDRAVLLAQRGTARVTLADTAAVPGDGDGGGVGLGHGEGPGVQAVGNPGVPGATIAHDLQRLTGHRSVCREHHGGDVGERFGKLGHH